MSQPDPKWYLVGILVLAILAVLTPRLFDFSAYSDESAYQICHEITVEYKNLVASNASDAEWEEFQANALPRLEDVSSDIKNHWRSSETGATQVLYQASQYELPKLISQREKASDARAEAAADAALAHARRVMDTPRQPEAPARNRRSNGKPSDNVLAMILAGDVLFAVIGGGYWISRRCNAS